MHMISQNIDGGATEVDGGAAEVDGGASTPVGPSVACHCYQHILQIRLFIL